MAPNAPNEIDENILDIPESAAIGRDEEEALSRRPLGSSDVPLNTNALLEFRRQLEKSGFDKL